MNPDEKTRQAFVRRAFVQAIEELARENGYASASEYATAVLDREIVEGTESAPLTANELFKQTVQRAVSNQLKVILNDEPN